MLGNGRTTIPREQIGTFKCTFCKDEVFKIISGVSFLFDKLAPKGKGMAPQPVTMYQCMSCGGYLKQQEDGSFHVVHHKEPPGDGDEWKKL